ncbi:hypothetical protein EJ06DRAFT_558430 [Trichodelitschia bisporula]|uniref:Extracellular membrane protein CFEM domain-containing protein n=1 Tax=Trichodelitschia bisporula TaxID=703511 RepID=A0A6G1HQ20_9PEZI|nr:hypothetical protein EJ06DRAFT_558430 [Trichodelitschia bisporula]
MKFSALLLLATATLIAAQAPTGAPKAGGLPKGGAPKMPKGAMPPKCAFSCLAQPFQAAGCAPKGGAGGFPGMPKGAGGAAPPKPTGAGGPGASPPKSIDPAVISAAQSAAASVRSCVCGGTAFAAAAASCVPSACASEPTAAAAYANMVNGICKGVSGFQALSAPAAAAAAPTPA